MLAQIQNINAGLDRYLDILETQNHNTIVCFDTVGWEN